MGNNPFYKHTVDVITKPVLSLGCYKNEAVNIDDVKPDTKPGPSKGKPKTGGTIPTYTPPKQTSNLTQYKFESARTDKRVSLNCSPLTTNTNSQEYIQRLLYVLGNGQYTLKKGQTIYGFLYSTLSKSCGLIFPYTPRIQISHPVNYDRTDISHSNLSISHYKNTPPPTIHLSATFTADTRANALHMLSALWFLRAVTKCDFGERANVDPNAIPGMPPPILYLNGYNQVLDNIPVVVTSFNYSLPNDKHYVSLGVNLDSNEQAFKETYLYSDVSNGNLYATFDGNMSGAEGMKYLNGVANSIKSLQESSTLMETNRYNNYYFNNWLPTEMQFDIQLSIQPNLLKYKKKFNLDWYKMGLFNLDDYKGGTTVYVPSSNGLTDVTNSDCKEKNEEIIREEYYERTIVGNGIEGGILTSKGKAAINAYKRVRKTIDVKQKEADEAAKKAGAKVNYDIGMNYTPTGKVTYSVVRDVSKVTEYKVKDVEDEFRKQSGLSSINKTYTFDRSGWTW